ncbi:hypothetical protein VNO78_11569 [Psophocarpus tetragonolobus]|uniref:Secreted protein n=1 Tax=Psophocarpus tetragonolobus TaxID=3891 RepID=A0AAN9SUG2_PSOTE
MKTKALAKILMPWRALILMLWRALTSSRSDNGDDNLYRLVVIGNGNQNLVRSGQECCGGRESCISTTLVHIVVATSSSIATFMVTPHKVLFLSPSTMSPSTSFIAMSSSLLPLST